MIKKCLEFNRPIDKLPASSTVSSPGDEHVLRYFFANDLPAIPKALRLFREAVASWELVCDIDIKHAANKQEANVIITTTSLTDQPASVLAMADVGPPDGYQLELLIDADEDWTPELFQATCAHELGHILGLRHIQQPGQLMNEVLNPGVVTPQPYDVMAAVAVWGSRS